MQEMDSSGSAHGTNYCLSGIKCCLCAYGKDEPLGRRMGSEGFNSASQVKS